MGLGSILDFLDNKSILVTGATGFIAKILVEKILRVQPNVKKIYLLVRAADAKSASQRLQNEMIDKDLFNIMREKYGSNLSKFMSEKVTPVAGDITVEENMGIKDLVLVKEMLTQVDVIFNLAANTNFDERYDVSFRLNTLGANHVLSFAKRCANIKVFIQVSTAYVAGEKEGLILETPYQMGESLNGKSGLDIDLEHKIIETRLKQLFAIGASESEITLAMKDLGMERAKTYGWPNTYVFTKAMAEMLTGEFKENISTVVLRPTVVTGTYKEPFPGWVEGVRTIDSVALGYGKGKLTFLLGDVNGITDVIPADMVVNSLLVAMVGHANEVGDVKIYHVGSSVRNPVVNKILHGYAISYFTKKPLINKDGKPIRVKEMTIYRTMESFQRYMALRYGLLSKALKLLNTIFCDYFKETYTELNKKINFVMRLVALYEPYMFFKGVFDDMNTQKLRIAARDGGVEVNMFDFDVKNINWEEYFVDIHLSGLVKYVFKRS